MDLHLRTDSSVASSKYDAFTRAFARQNQHFETAIQSLDSLNQEIVQVFLSSQSDGNLSEDPVIAARWSHQCHHSMVLMRRLLIDAQGKFRKMMSDNQALASRIDQDIQSAHLQVSALRAELADTNQRIKDICSESMAGNVITTCMPPTSTTNTTTVISTAEGHWLKDSQLGHPVTESTVKVSRVCSSSPPIADKGGGGGGGTKSPADLVESSHRQVQSPKSTVPQGSKVGEQNTNLVNGSSPDQTGKVNKNPETVGTEQNILDKVSDEAFSGSGRKFAHDGSERPQVPPKQLGLASKGSRDLLGKDAKEKPEGLTESSKTSEELSVSKHKGHRRERRSLKGSDVQKSILEDLKSQQSNAKLDDSKSELQRSESDGNQNSAPECDLSISGSPFKEGGSKVASEESVACSSSSLKSSPRKSSESATKEDSKRDDFSVDFHRSSPPVKDESNAQCFPLPKDSSEVYLHKETANGHRYKAKTRSDPLDRRSDKCAQEFSVLSSPSSVMRHKTGVSKLQLGICSWENRQFDPKESWYKTQDNSSSMSGKSMDESSSKEETSDSQDGLPPEFCDQRPIRDENKGGRFVIFDSKNMRGAYNDWRTTLSESYRDQQQMPESWKGSATEQKDSKSVDDKRQVPEKDQSSCGLIQDSSYYRKSENLEYSPYKGCGKSPEESHLSEVEALKIRNSALLRDLEEVMESRDEKAKENAAMAAKLEHMDKELKHAKEALSALKQDRKRLKAEKFDLLTQMKQLYSTLEDKEEELREFIRNYEQKMKESDENIKQMTKEREEMEQERWSILKRARDEAERAVLLCTQLGLKDAHIKELQDEIALLKEKRLSSNHDPRQSNGFGSPGSISYRTANGIDSRGTPTPTPGSDPTTSPSYAGTPTISMQYVDPLSPRKGPMMQTLSPEHRPALLSRSAEDIFNSAGLDMSSVKKKSKEKKGTWGSISRVFSRSKKRKPLDPELFESQRSSWSPKECPSPLSEESYVQKLRLLEEAHGTPMQHWRAATVLAWLEITMDMPQYGAACADNIKSGKLLLELSDSELEEGLGITNVMHRRKLRLAIEEHRQPSLCRYPKICLLTHAWVAEEWLPSVALQCYLPSFSEHLVDGRVLDTLTKKDLEKHFGITRKFHQLSLMHAIQLLRMLNFDRQILNQRRTNSETMDIDPLVWTNQRLIRWVASIELVEYAENLKGTGVHGALAVLEPSFTADTIATALGIPTSKNIVRRHLTTEWNNLIQPARLSLESESMVSKKSKSEKRLASGSSSISLVSQGRSSSSIMPSYARRTLDRYDRRRSSWRESLRSLTSTKKTPPAQSSTAERPHLLPLSPKLNATRHRRTFSSHSDVETLTVTPV